MTNHNFIIVFLFALFICSCENEAEIDTDKQLSFDYAGKYRPQIHFSSKHNWLNDPNGLVYFDGEYHLFYQYNPFGSGWGFMSWGHAVSTDLIHWEQLNVAMRPDALGDIFSGCAVIDKNNTAGFGENAMVALYTSAGKTQTQSIAYSTDKGRTFIKYSKNPVLKNPGRPDFRDPKVFWHEATNKWVMSLATGRTISFYESPNLKEWTKISEFGFDMGAQGGIWECPDLFPLMIEGKVKWVLLVSVNLGAPNGGSGTQYFIGDFNGKDFIADKSTYPKWLDFGKDNYAGITWDNIPASDGRKIQIAWMNNWDYAGKIPTFSDGTNGSRGNMTLPRELTLGKNKQGEIILLNKVVAEIEKIASEWETVSNGNFENEKEFEIDLQNKKAYHLQLTTNLSKEQVLSISLKNSKGELSTIEINNQSERIYFDRKNSGEISFSDLFGNLSYGPFPYNSDRVILDLYVDQSSIELVANDGVLTLSNLVFPSSTYNQIKLKINAGSIPLYIKTRTLASIWE